MTVSLKEYTKSFHKEIESTEFAKKLIKGTVTELQYYNYLFQFKGIYKTIEDVGEKLNLYKDIESVKRYYKIIDDMFSFEEQYPFLEELATTSYRDYLTSIKDPIKLKSHMYVRYMGDLNGGQILKERLNHLPTNLYEFDDAEELKVKLRDFFADADREEARKAFIYNISIYRKL